jgi:hypothetical protein
MGQGSSSPAAYLVVKSAGYVVIGLASGQLSLRRNFPSSIPTVMGESPFVGADYGTMLLK